MYLMISRWNNGKSQTKQAILKKKLVETSLKKKSVVESRKTPKNVVANVLPSAPSHEVPPGALSSSRLTVEWSFMQAKLHNNPLLDFDRLESGSLNESDGGEECESILTALRRAKRRAARRSAKAAALVESGDDGQGEKMMIEEGLGGERASTGGKTLSSLRLTLNGH
jgi:hypothetical protein